jgi:GxxExxY protein
MDARINENEISKVIVDCAIEVHRSLGGPGLLESVYEEALVWELSQKGCHVKRQVVTDSVQRTFLASPLRIDVVVNELVLIECKSLSKYDDIFESQMLTYLRLSNLKLGLVINFGQKLVKDGIHRVVNGL